MHRALTLILIALAGALLGVVALRVIQSHARIPGADGHGLPVVCSDADQCWQGGRRVRPPNPEFDACDTTDNGNFAWARLPAQPGLIGSMLAGSVWVCEGAE